MDSIFPFSSNICILYTVFSFFCQVKNCALFSVNSLVFGFEKMEFKIERKREEGVYELKIVFQYDWI